MPLGKKKVNVLTFLIGVVSYGVFYVGCRIGYELYTTFTAHPIHYGVQNSFGVFYSYYIVFPVCFFLPLLKNNSIIRKALMVAPLLLLFLVFYASNPLRTFLLLLCTVLGYLTIFILEKANSKFFLQ